MPKLFISYKRGTDGVQKLMARLRDERYALWFDRDDIHLGDPDWEAKIVQGIRECAGVILCLTPEACKSDPIRFEVSTAKNAGKHIFPVMLEPLDNIGNCLESLSLSRKQHVEPLHGVDDWEEQFQKLLRGLKDKDIVVTPHDERKQRDTDEYRLHQQYLSQLINRIGRLRLGAINPDATDVEGAPLEDIYVPLPMKQTISVEIENYRITDWWLDEKGTDTRRTRWGTANVDDYPRAQRTRPHQKDLEDEVALASLVDMRQMELDEKYEQAKESGESGERFRGSVDDGVHPEEIPLFAHDVAAATKRLVVLGGPGSGKSTFVKYLALCLAGEARENWLRSASVETLGRWPHGELTPVYVELRAFVSSDYFPDDLEAKPTAAHLWQYIKAEILGDGLADYAGQLEHDLQAGHAVLILDGLDEVPYPRRKGALQARQEQLRALAQSLNDTYGKTRILVASRPYAYEGWTLPGFSSVELAPFTDNERLNLATNLYRVAGDDEADVKAGRLLKALSDVDDELKDRPLFVTLMATVFSAGEAEGLPTRKGALYRESILLLLERWTTAKGYRRRLTDLLGDSTRDDLLDWLGAMAYDVHEQLGDAPGTPEIPQELLGKHILRIASIDPSVQAVQIVSYLSENAGVLVSPGHKQGAPVLQFAHRTFQEYLAARHIVSTCDESFEPLRQLMLERPQLWRIPARLVADVLVNDEQFQDRDLWTLMDDLLYEDAPNSIDAADDPRLWLVWLCSRYGLEQDIPAPQRRGERSVRDNIANWQTLLIQTSQALPPG